MLIKLSITPEIAKKGEREEKEKREDKEKALKKKMHCLLSYN